MTQKHDETTVFLKLATLPYIERYRKNADISKLPHDIQSRDQLLFWAAIDNNNALFKYLILQPNFQINIQAGKTSLFNWIFREKKKGRTPLMWAARLGNNELVELLLSHGACPYLKDPDGNTALDLAVQAERFETIKLFAQRQIITAKALSIAAEKNLIGIMILLLKSGRGMEALTKYQQKNTFFDLKVQP